VVPELPAFSLPLRCAQAAQAPPLDGEASVMHAHSGRRATPRARRQFRVLAANPRRWRERRMRVSPPQWLPAWRSGAENWTYPREGLSCRASPAQADTAPHHRGRILRNRTSPFHLSQLLHLGREARPARSNSNCLAASRISRSRRPTSASNSSTTHTVQDSSATARHLIVVPLVDLEQLGIERLDDRLGGDVKLLVVALLHGPPAAGLIDWRPASARCMVSAKKMTFAVDVARGAGLRSG